MQAGDLLDLEIERLAAGGEGIGRAEGCVVFVPLAAPGDRVRVRVREVHARFARAELAELLRSGPGRRNPGCRHFGRCGGCAWLHLGEDVQREARLSILRDALVRIGKLSALPPIEWLGSPRALGYRARARLSCEDGAVGFRERRSRRVVDVERCAVLDPPTQHALDDLRRAERGSSGSREVELRGFGSDALGLAVSPGAFFQANRAIWGPFRRLVSEACGEGERLLELYAGAGFFTVALAPRFREVVAVERGPAARDLRRNVSARVFAVAAERFAGARFAGFRPEVVLVNPPRAGCHKTVLDALIACPARRIVYVSCDPATLARDLARLASVFHLTRVTCIDAMPQTAHVEAMAVVERA